MPGGCVGIVPWHGYIPAHVCSKLLAVCSVMGWRVRVRLVTVRVRAGTGTMSICSASEGSSQIACTRQRDRMLYPEHALSHLKRLGLELDPLGCKKCK